MIPQIQFCTTSCLVLLSTLATAQVLTKSDAGLTTPEFIQVLGHSSGSVPLSSLITLSAYDVNGDGKVDILVSGSDPATNSATLATTLLRNTGSQNFTQVLGNNSTYCSPSYPGGADQVAPFCVLADLNGDGLLDKIFVGEYPNATNSAEVDYPYVKVEYATGPGIWAAPVKYGIGGRGLYIASVAVGDFNGDGHTDIAVLRLSQFPTGGTDFVYGFVYVLWGKADGTFTVSTGVPTNILNETGGDLTEFFPDMHISAVDLNGDGKTDIIATSGPFGIFSVMLGSSNGLTAGQLLPLLGNPSDTILTADLNKDGFGDLVFQESSDRQLHVLSGGGANSAVSSWFSRDQVLPLNEGDPHVLGIVAGDFNGDGRLDLAVTTMANLDIFTQNADGSFTSPRQYALTSGNTLLAMADVNGDDKLDLIVGGNPLAIYYGNGYGSFTGPAVTSNLVTNATVATGDFNKDGKADVVTAAGENCNKNGCSTLVSVFMGSGLGWFQPMKKYTVSTPVDALAVGDINGDGFPDIVTMYEYGDQSAGADVSVLLGQAGGTFAAAKSYFIAMAGVDIYLRDVNNDGKLDLITDSGVALGKGDGSFGSLIRFPYVPFVGCPTCQSIAVGDFNGDGKIDVLYSQNGVHVLLGDGTGHFTEKIAYSPQGPPVLAVGDLNGDGKLDFIASVGHLQAEGVAIYLGNGDGTFTAGEADSVAPTAGATYGGQIVSLNIHDMNGDGIPDILVATTSGMPIFLGKGGGHFTAPLVFASSSGSFGTSAFAIADYDSNGTPDLAVPNYNGVARLLNTGYSTWPKVSSLPAATPFPEP